MTRAAKTVKTAKKVDKAGKVHALRTALAKDPDIPPRVRGRLARAIADLKDPTRYVIITSSLHALYDVERDTYVILLRPKDIDARHCTVFKRRAAAQAVATWLRHRDLAEAARRQRNPAKRKTRERDYQVVRCRLRSNDDRDTPMIVFDSLPKRITAKVQRHARQALATRPV